MSVLPLAPVPDSRTGRDRLEMLTALIAAPSFDPLYRLEVIRIPLGHPVYRWECLVAECLRPRTGRGDLCGAHELLWRERRDGGMPRREFLRTASPVGAADHVEEHPCRICPQRPARQTTLRLCQYHQFRWYNERKRRGWEFEDWLAQQKPLPGHGLCRVEVCPEMADSPLALCYRHEAAYRRQGSPGGAVLPSQWGTRFGRRGLAVPVGYSDEAAFRHWCAKAPAVFRSSQLNLRGIRPLVSAELRWGLCAHARNPSRTEWELSQVQNIVHFCRKHDVRSLTDLGSSDEASLREAAGREAPVIARAIVDGLKPLYVTPEETREHGYVLTDHFGRRPTARSGRIDLTPVTQRWLRDLLWDHVADVLRSPRCPRSGRPFDDMRRAGLELSAFLEIHAPGGGHDPCTLTAAHMQRFAADQLHRERERLPSLGAKGVHGTVSIVTENTRHAVVRNTRRLLREALESGRAQQLGLDRGFITSMQPAGRVTRRTRPPFPDEVAQALADEQNLKELAATYDVLDRGLRDAWEAIIITGRRCGEILNLRLDCLGRYGGVPILWHDQTKVGNYDQALRIPERLYQLLEVRREKTLELFAARHNRMPDPAERAQLALFPTSNRNADGRRALTYNWFHRGFKRWIDELDIGRWVPHQARHSLATSLLRAGASLSHIRRYLGHVSDRMAEHYIHLTQSDLEEALQRVWVAGPGSANPGELLTEPTTPLTRAQATALAIDLSRRSTPAEGGFCTFQPVVDGGACPWNLDCHHCDKFVLSGADLLYWRRKREQWRLLAEGAPDDATADYLHGYFEPTAKAIDGLEKALAGLGLLEDALALDLRKPQDYFHRIWATAFRATDLAETAEPDDADGAEPGFGQETEQP